MRWLLGLTMMGVVTGETAAAPPFGADAARDPRACRCFAAGTCDLRTTNTDEVQDMASRAIDVFFYGLFMDPEILRAKGLHPIDSRQASVSGMSLQIGQRAALVPDPDGRVHGFVIGLSHAELERLYADPGVAAYRPEAVRAELADGSRVAALCYNLPPSAETVRANPEYAEKLRAVASRLGLPPDYVAGIR